MATLTAATGESGSGPKQRITVGLDIGTSKVCALIASHDEDTDNLNILGIGITDSEGLNRGVVVNIDKTVRTIRKVIDQAEQQAGIKIEEVVVGIAGDHIEAFQSRGIIGISNGNREIVQEDVDRIIRESRNIKLPPERNILHVIPQEFIIDGQDGITAPIGMSGVRMEANVHVVTGLSTAIHNIYKCVERNGIKVKEIVLEPLACSRAVLNEEEKEVGVALIDIGGGTTDIAIFEANVIRFTSVFGVAGKQVTDDIRKGMGIIASQAERIKREYGHGYLNSIMNDEVFMIPGIGGRKPMEITKSFLCRIIQPRLAEIFEFALAELRRSGYGGSLGAGIVITGGATLIPGVDELAAEVLGMPVKIGYPSGLSYQGLAPEVESPMYSTCVGLALYGIRKDKDDGIEVEAADADDNDTSEDHTGANSEKKSKKSIFSKVKDMLDNI